MKEYISIGKNVDMAIEAGLMSLGLNREDVDIKILETGGLFKKAKVCLIYEDTPIAEPVEEVKVKDQQDEKSINDVEIQSVENNISAEINETIEDIKEEISTLSQQNLEVEQNKFSTENKAETAEIVDKDNVSTNCHQEPRKEVSPDELKIRVVSFLEGLVKKFNIEATIQCEIVENELHCQILGDQVGKLIGYRGETLSAIQNILGCLKVSGEGRYRVYLDIDNYKKKREQTLVDLANKMADKAEEIERNVHLEPMSAYERRIVHSTLQNRELVETESMGEGLKRHVVIKFKR